ncbi:MAG: hypothetical protein ABL995_08575 [Bryobacteraceae bacterium]
MRRANLIIALSEALPVPGFESFWNVLPKSSTALYRPDIVEWRVPNDIVDKLNRLGLHELRETMVLCNLDPTGPDPWDLKQLGVDGRGYAAMLVLSFPEVYFVFLGGPSPLPLELPDTLDDVQRRLISARRESINHHHVLEWPQVLRLAELLHFHASGFRTLFDPYGLRSSLKLLLLGINKDNQRGLMYLPDIKSRLERCAASADEEDDYVSLHAYAAFKMGYCVSVLRSEEEFNRVLKDANTPLNLVISDWDLAYADHEEVNSVESQRDSTELLERVEFDPDDSTGRRENRLKRDKISVLVVSTYSSKRLTTFLARDKERRIVLGKPHSGVHSVKSHIEQITQRTDLEVLKRVSGQLSADALAPDQRPRAEVSQSGDSGRTSSDVEPQAATRNHSLPYARSVVTNHLLQRARDIQMDSSRPVDDGVLQAVLALEAKELLGELSRTTAYDALRLQIEGELLAELSWFGVDFQDEVKRRIKGVTEEADRLLQHEAKMGAEVSALERSRDSFLYGLIDNLRRRYSNSGQIVASEHCLREINNLEAQIRKSSVAAVGAEGRLPRLWNWLISWFWEYVRWATDHGTSVGAVIKANSLVIGCSTLVYCALLFSYNPLPDVGVWQQLGLASGHSLFTFAELQPGVQEFDLAMIGNKLGPTAVFLYRLALLIEIGFAYLNLGLMISVLYRRLMRTGA